MKDIAINVSLPAESFGLVRSGEKRTLRHKRNPRIDRFFIAKSPTVVNISGQGEKITRQISQIERTPEEWIVHIKRGA